MFAKCLNFFIPTKNNLTLDFIERIEGGIITLNDIQCSVIMILNNPYFRKPKLTKEGRRALRELQENLLYIRCWVLERGSCFKYASLHTQNNDDTLLRVGTEFCLAINNVCGCMVRTSHYLYCDLR